MDTKNLSPLKIENDWEEGDDEVTAKIPMEELFAANNCAYCDRSISEIRIVLLQAKPEFEEYFKKTLYAVVIKEDSSYYWVGFPLKSSSNNLIKWEKKIWKKLYGFTIALTLEED